MLDDNLGYPLAIFNGPDGELLRRILYALTNNGAVGLAPNNPHGILLRQILYAIQNQTGGGGSGHFDAQGNIQVYDSVSMTWRTVTAPGGILTVT